MPKKKIRPPEIAKGGIGPVKSFMDIHRALPYGREPGKKPEGKPPKPTAPPPASGTKIFMEIHDKHAKAVKENQPGLFDGIDDVITALQLEENDLTDTLRKLKDARDKADERIKALEGRVDVLNAARKKAEKWLEKKK